MAKRKLIELQFPFGGLSRNDGYQREPPYTTARCQNVRPRCVFENRKRGGSRPGVARAFYDQLGSGNPVRLLNRVTTAEDTTLHSWIDQFTDTAFLDVWSVASWLNASPGLWNHLAIVPAGGQDTGLVRDALADFDTSKPYSIQVYIVPFLGSYYGTYSIFARMDNSSPDATQDGIAARLTISGETGTYSGKLTSYVGGTPTEYDFSGGSVGAPLFGWFEVVVNGNTVTCFWRGTQLVSQAVSAHTGTRIGFGVKHTGDTGAALVDAFAVYHHRTYSENLSRDVIVASANGALYKDDAQGGMDLVSTSLTLAHDRPLSSAQRGQKLYIADDGRKKADADTGTIDATGLQLDDTNVSDWTTLGIDADDDVVVLTNGTGSVTDGVYGIASVSADYVTLASAAGGSGSCSYEIRRGAKVYDPKADTLTLWFAASGKGQVPQGCPVICRYRDRLVMAADRIWYMSRQGDPTDWNYGASAEDVGRAAAGTSSEAGIPGSKILALIPHTDDYLILGCTDSIWVMRGDPAFGGTLDVLEQETGILHRDAWCYGPNGETLFLGADGLYVIAPGANTPPQKLSHRLPDDFQFPVDAGQTVQMAYDEVFNGVLFSVSPEGGWGTASYWFEWEDGTFWRDILPRLRQPTAVLAIRGDLYSQGGVLLGCRDGYLRRFSRNDATDDGDTITSLVFFGPIKLGDAQWFEGIIREIQTSLAEVSADVDWFAFFGTHHEVIYSENYTDWGTFYSRLNYSVRPNGVGGSFALALSSTRKAAWAVEMIQAVIDRRKHQRLP